MSADQVRLLIRDGKLRAPTTGYADGFMQANLAILPKTYADDFREFCRINPKSCPLVGIGQPGNPGLDGLGAIDIRTDVPRYRVYRNGVHTDTVDDLVDLWRDDLVTFALGCSFSFESAILQAGIDIRHISANRNVPMYVTNIQTTAAGPFGGPKVESMRDPGPAPGRKGLDRVRADRHKQQGPTDGFVVMKAQDADLASAGFPVSKLERETLHDRAYLELKRAIMSGAIRPGAITRSTT